MKSIAFWSRDHKYTARFFIAICHILLFAFACYVGVKLKEMKLFISLSVFWWCLGAIAFIIVFFSKKYHYLSFRIKKLLDAVVLVSGFLLIASFSNQKDVAHYSSYNSLQGTLITKKSKSSNSSPKTSFQDIRRQLKEFRKAFRHHNVSAGGILLAIFLGVILGFIVLGASCSLACSNNGALSLLVLLLGFTGIFFICQWILRSMPAKESTRKALKSSDNDNFN